MPQMGWKCIEERRWAGLVEGIRDPDQKTYLQGESLTVPWVATINRYVKAYINGLYQHMPMIHLRTLDLNDLELYHILALASIGAIYCFEPEIGALLHTIAVDLLPEEVTISKVQTIILCLSFAVWNGNRQLLEKDLFLHPLLSRSLLRLRQQAESGWIKDEERRRTCFSGYCLLVQLQLLFNLPFSIKLSELDMSLPCSEEEWADGAREAQPNFLEAFSALFSGNVRCSEFGAFILISALLSTILDTRRVSDEFEKFDLALDNWQKLWVAHPNMGAMAFNASALYRVATIRRVEDYSRYVHFLSLMSVKMFFLANEQECAEQIYRMLEEREMPRGAATIRAIVATCASLQLEVNLGLKYLAQTSSPSWSIEHMFCKVELSMSLTIY